MCSLQNEEVQTGNSLDLAFESISSERKDLIHAMPKYINTNRDKIALHTTLGFLLCWLTNIY